MSRNTSPTPGSEDSNTRPAFSPERLAQISSEIDNIASINKSTKRKFSDVEGRMEALRRESDSYSRYSSQIISEMGNIDSILKSTKRELSDQKGRIEALTRELHSSTRYSSPPSSGTPRRDDESSVRPRGNPTKLASDTSSIDSIHSTSKSKPQKELDAQDDHRIDTMARSGSVRSSSRYQSARSSATQLQCDCESRALHPSEWSGHGFSERSRRGQADIPRSDRSSGRGFHGKESNEEESFAGEKGRRSPINEEEDPEAGMRKLYAELLSYCLRTRDRYSEDERIQRCRGAR